MAIRVTCPSCGRVGRGPEHAVGRTVRCPGCSHVYRLTAEMVAPDGDVAAEGSSTKPAPAPPPGAASAGVSGATGDATAAADDSRPVHALPGGLHVPFPVLIGGALGVGLMAVLSSWAVLSLIRGRDATVASPPDSRVAQATVGRLPAPAGAAGSTPTPAPAVATPPQAPTGPVVSAPASQAGAKTGPAPQAVAPAEISVADLIATPDEATSRPEPKADPESERPGESDVAAQARAGAAAAAAHDDGARKSLSTADIVAENEPSVALIKGTSSGGTGFLVAPGLVATNAHVLDDEFISDLEVRFVSADDKHNDPLKAELLYDDPERDLAFLAVKTDLKPLRVAATYTFRKGEDITVIGNPGFGDGQLENAISRGVMSTKTQIDGRNFYQLGIAINPGNSGGPVFDSSGRVIGVATLKASKQEATGFSIPIEDLQAALAKVGKESTSDADRYRSRHRIVTASKGLGSGGALMCLLIDLRRAAALSKSPEVKELLGKLEPVVAELDEDFFPSLVKHATVIKNDVLIAPPVKRMVGDMSDNFKRIRTAYSAHKNVDDTVLRPWKQTHKKLITSLSTALKMEVPKELMVAFDDHVPSQPTIVIMNSQSLGAYGSRLRHGSLSSRRPPGGITRPPSLRERMGRPGIR